MTAQCMVCRQESFWLSVVGRLLETKLLQLLRFKAGDVYSVSVGGFFGAEAPSREGVVAASGAQVLGSRLHDSK